jgi:hypothetical protein
VRSADWWPDAPRLKPLEPERLCTVGGWVENASVREKLARHAEYLPRRDHVLWAGTQSS